MLELVRDGGRPVPARFRSAYYEKIAAELCRAPILSNGTVLDAVRVVQRVLLRPPIEA
jgi:hypothetical protein